MIDESVYSQRIKMTPDGKFEVSDFTIAVDYEIYISARLDEDISSGTSANPNIELTISGGELYNPNIDTSEKADLVFDENLSPYFTKAIP